MNKKYIDNLNILDFPIISHQILLYYLKLYCYLKQYLILEFLFNCKSGFSCKFFSKSITLFVCTLYNHYLIEFVLKSCCSVKLVGEGFAHIFMQTISRMFLLFLSLLPPFLTSSDLYCDISNNPGRHRRSSVNSVYI